VLVDVRPLQGPSAGRGVGTYARGLLKGLIAEGFDSRLTLLLDAGLDEPSLPPGGYKLAGSRRRYHGQLAAYEEAVALGADLARLRPALFHAIDLRLPGRSPCPLVVTVHDLIPWAWGGPRMRGERLRFWLGRRLLKRADALIAVSGATADDAERIAAVDRRRVRVIPEAPDAVFEPKPGAQERVRQRWGIEPGYLLFVGALDARKDPAGLLRAWIVARQERTQLQLVVAGDPGRQAPPSMRDAKMLGRVADVELADLYTAAGCFVFPSR
jgi:glycosyltransferase involved in cell wall biosynthesis